MPKKFTFFLAQLKKAVYLQRSKSMRVTRTPPACGFFCGPYILKFESSTPTDAVAVMLAGSRTWNLEHPYRSLSFNVQNLLEMNKFEEEIVRINEEMDEKVAPIQQRIGELEAQNHNMKELRKINAAQIKELYDQKRAIEEQCALKKQRLYDESKEFYSVNMSASKLRYLLRGFMAQHDEIKEMWTAYVTANFGAAQEECLLEVEGGAA